MEWVLRSPQIHSTFSNLGFVHADGYHINENCTAALETILHNILTEDKYLRSYRRSISFGQNIKKDLIPLLIHAKDDKVIELLIKIFVNLTIPVECLLLVDVISKNDFGRHTIFEINNLLASTKSAFTDHRATKVVVDFLKKHIYYKQEAKLPLEHCTNINNSLLLLRNIVHIPEELNGQSPNYKGPTHAVQNQILWNVFSQSIDKVLIRLMTAPDAKKWSVTMVQLIALLYKDQHVVTLQKFLNLWLEASLSESSEDNESNTSPPDRGSDDSSPMLTSDPPSDSSDTGGSGKVNDETNSVYKNWDASFNNKENANRAFAVPPSGMDLVTTDKKDFAGSSNDDAMKFDNENSTSYCSGQNSEPNGQVPNQRKTEHKPVISENSDCGYGTLIDNQESISTSSDEDGLPAKKPVHQKPHNLKQKPNTNVRSSCTIQERKKKKVVRRGKSNLYASTNVQGLSHKRPTDDDISNILKEFTIDFLLKGYNPLVKTLLSQILTNLQLEIDTSHFFWLVTYFLKFASQIELNLDHVSSVLSFEIVSYLTAEGVNLCEQFELAIKLDGNDLKPCIRRLHLVVTAIREIIQTIDLYKKIPHLCKDDRDKLDKLHIQICETEEVRSLLVLLLRYYNPKYHTKQYLQDLIVTNHILLTFMDSATQLTEYKSSNCMLEHIQQFATSEMMYQYGLLLEDYSSNGEFVNDCIFTLMHHVGGELDRLITLFQPKILKIFSSIWKSEFEICDDWSDLIEYVINTFIKKPHALQSAANIRLDTENFDDDKVETKLEIYPNAEGTADATAGDPDMRPTRKCLENSTRLEKWTDDELSSLSWSYMQCSAQSDVIEEIIRLFKEDGIRKSRDSLINQLFKQNLINKDEFEKLVKGESDKNMKTDQLNKEMRDNEIGKLCKQLAQDGKSNFLDWVQKILLETCYLKIHLEKKSSRDNNDEPAAKIPKYDDLNEMHILSPISYHSLLLNQSVALVPWNHKQASICKDLKFLHLLHKLGFHMPADSGKVFIRIPHFWSAQFMYDVAGKISPIDKSKFKFSINDISDSRMASMKQQDSLMLSEKLTNDLTMIEPTENLYQIHKQKHHATMVNFTPMPGNLISEVAEVDKHNWLEVVQKSQEYKIALNLESRSMEEDIESDVTMELPTKGTPIFAAPLMPPIMSATQDASHFTVQVTESEYCNNSLCETASVASDLTQMYVSDEDEKPEVTVRPAVEANASNNK